MEYCFSILDSYTPDTLPMKRLVQYMGRLAALYGNDDQVHFSRIEAGSALLIANIEPPAIPKVRERIAGVSNDTAPPDALKAWDELNLLLRRDNATGMLTEDKNIKVLDFPGRNVPEPDFKRTLSQVAALEGRIVGIAGMDDTKHVHIEYGGGKFSCECNESMARELRDFLYEDEIRLHGQARYRRGDDGIWELRDFRIKSYERLDNMPLSQAVGKLRAIANEGWKEMGDSWAGILQLRQQNEERP